MRTRSRLGFCLAASTIAAIAGAGRALADANHDRPAYLLVGVAPQFDGELDVSGLDDETLRATASQLGTPLVRVKIGTYVAGFNIKSTRFVGAPSPITIDLDGAPLDPDHPSYDGHQYTILGSFQTLAPDSKVHMMTPYPGVIPAEVQESFFNASAHFDDPEALSPFATTVEMALFVYDHQGQHQSGAVATVQQILDAMFDAPVGAEVELVCHSPCEGEGTIFPHDPNEDGVFRYHSLFDPEAERVAVDVCLPVPADVLQSSVNVSKNGVLPVVVLSTADFDAVHELDPATVTAVLVDDHGQVVTDSAVAAVRWATEDVNHDGRADVTFKFSVPALVSGANAPLSEFSAYIDFRGDTVAGMCVEGRDAVRVVPSKK